MNEVKTCNKCNQELDVKAFHKKSDNADGYHNACKVCRSEGAGHTPTLRTRMKGNQETKIEVPEVSQEDLFAEVRSLSEAYPHNRIYQRAAREVTQNPDGEHTLKTQEILFRLWHRRMEKAGATFDLDEEAPILSEFKEKKLRTTEVSFTGAEERELYGFSDESE